MKKFCMKLATTTAGALLILAAPGQANPGIKSGPYAGISVGLSNLSGDQDFKATNNDPLIGGVTDARRFGLSANSFGGAIFAGYGHRMNCYWLAAELSYLFDRLNSEQKARLAASPKDVIWKSRSTGAWGGALHFGYVPHHANWMVYAIAGVEFRKFQVSFEDQLVPATLAASINKKHNSVAFVPGLGVRINLTKNVAFRGEYKYAFHRSKSFSASAPQAGGGTDTSTLKHSPRVQTFQVGIVYSF